MSHVSAESTGEFFGRRRKRKFRNKNAVGINFTTERENREYNFKENKTLASAALTHTQVKFAAPEAQFVGAKGPSARGLKMLPGTFLLRHRTHSARTTHKAAFRPGGGWRRVRKFCAPQHPNLDQGCRFRFAQPHTRTHTHALSGRFCRPCSSLALAFKLSGERLTVGIICKVPKIAQRIPGGARPNS